MGRSGAVFGRQVGAKLAAKRAPKSKQNLVGNRSGFGCLLGWDPGGILAALGAQNGAKLAPKTDKKSVPTSKGEFFKKCGFSNGKPRFLMVQGVDFGSKIRSKIDLRMEAGSGSHFGSIFLRSGAVLGAKLGLRWAPRGAKNRSKKRSKTRGQKEGILEAKTGRLEAPGEARGGGATSFDPPTSPRP